MRKIIETTSTLILWAIFLIGSGLAIFDFFFNADASEKIQTHLHLIALAPVVAVTFLGGMLIAVRFSKNDSGKKTCASEHIIQWSEEELLEAQNGKIVDLHFASKGLDCKVLSRDVAALVLHTENQTRHLTVVPPIAEDAAWNLQKIAARSIVIIIFFLPSAF